VHPLKEMLPKYYEVRGWGTDGVPSDEKKEALGL
jgi:aldehyde:ferredoxin oxidoreductase